MPFLLPNQQYHSTEGKTIITLCAKEIPHSLVSFNHYSMTLLTHAPETGTINQLQFSDTGFWYVRHANLEPDSSGTRFQHWLAAKTVKIALSSQGSTTATVLKSH